jgi:hypothetical protein
VPPYADWNQSNTLVRIEAIITSLIFEHALRIRLTADSVNTPASSRPETPVNDGAEANAGQDAIREESKAKNIVGKMNNLMSSDLNNIVAGKDFMMLGESQCVAAFFLLTLLRRSCIRAVDDRRFGMVPL